MQSSVGKIPSNKKSSTKKIEDFNVDELMGGDFSVDIPMPPPTTKLSTDKKRKHSSEPATVIIPISKKLSSTNKPIVPLDQEISEHKQQLRELQKTDPEFYQHLVESEKDLLNFGADDDMVDEDGNSDDDAELDEAEDEDDIVERRVFEEGGVVL